MKFAGAAILAWLFIDHIAAPAVSRALTRIFGRHNTS